MESYVLQNLEASGFAVIENVFSTEETDKLISAIKIAAQDKENFRKSNDLFAIRNLLGEIPEIKNLIQTSNFRDIVSQLPGGKYFVTKAIYFDKPEHSNWSVAWHQDKTISVDRRMTINGFGPWTLKQGLQSVQPTLEYLQNICAIRIHLDDCDETNGALKVVPGSHIKGIIPDAEYFDYTPSSKIVEVKRGGVMLMKPLLLHSSHKSISTNNRRVIHLEFSSMELPAGLQWRER